MTTRSVKQTRWDWFDGEGLTRRRDMSNIVWHCGCRSPTSSETVLPREGEWTPFECFVLPGELPLIKMRSVIQLYDLLHSDCRFSSSRFCKSSETFIRRYSTFIVVFPGKVRAIFRFMGLSVKNLLALFNDEWWLSWLCSVMIWRGGALLISTSLHGFSSWCSGCSNNQKHTSSGNIQTVPWCTCDLQRLCLLN